MALENNTGGNEMTGNLDANTAATLALLTDTARAGRGGYGFGGGEGGYYGGPFATPSANAVRMNRNNDRIKDCCDDMRLTLDQAEESRRFSEVCSRINDSELRNSDRLRDIEREIAANARRQADCCCETQKEILRLDAANTARFAELSKQQAIDSGDLKAGQAAISAKMDSYKEISELVAENKALQTRIACGCVTGCTTPCNG